MPDLPDRLAEALKDRYTLQRELGRGGMATVYLAEDLKHERRVALKVLRPELAAVLGPERFLREVKIAAQLTHPHILPLHDSGNADGFLYYVMPYVEGESLRDRLNRETQLPLDEALQISREVADALSYAHSYGVIHRDIKPENILLESGHAVVADFGIARAIDQAGGERLTETGVALGTPTYMSPEQAGGSRELDGRSDLYSLGCVLYEMLAGQPPFTGPTAQAVLARKSVDAVPSLRTVREAVPPQLEATILRALARVPADRHATASQFAEAIDEHAEAPPAPRWPRRLVVAVVLVVLAVTLTAALAFWPRPRAPIDSALVVVLPFRVTGADSSVAWLREGMVDLLAAKFTGEGGVRAVAPSTTVSGWRQAAGSSEADLPENEAVELAQRLGAGQVILGGVLATPGRLVLNASVFTVPAGRRQVSAAVEGHPDSIAALVDALAAELLASAAGQPQERLTALTSASLPALRAYLDGQSKFRRGHYEEAARDFERAVDVDSTFAVAAVYMAAAAGWITAQSAGQQDRALRLAWAARDRLDARDRAYLATFTGPSYPLPMSPAEQLVAQRQAADLLPDRPDVWYGVGEVEFHHAQNLALVGAPSRAEAAFRQAVALDSSYPPPMEHLLDLAFRERDTTEVRRLLQTYVARFASSDVADYYRWRAAVVLRDSAARAQLVARFDGMSSQSLWRVVGYAQVDELGLDDADRAAEVLARRPTDRIPSIYQLTDLAMNRGRPRASEAVTDELVRDPRLNHEVLRSRVWRALYWDGDTASAGRIVRDLARSADSPLAAQSSERSDQLRDVCVVAHWRMAEGQRDPVSSAVARLRQAISPRDAPETVAYARECGAALEAMYAVAARQPAARRAVDRLDSLTQGGVRVGVDFNYNNAYPYSLIVARLLEELGDLPGAVAVAQRRTYNWGAGFLSVYLETVGRLAARTGDRETAIRAYRHYLALRSDPEPALKPKVDAVRAELAKLVGEPRAR